MQNVSATALKGVDKKVRIIYSISTGNIFNPPFALNFLMVSSEKLGRNSK